jgi:hypothetical protein
LPSSNRIYVLNNTENEYGLGGNWYKSSNLTQCVPCLICIFQYVSLFS